MQSTSSFDAFLLLSFGGPEGMSDVIPFLENVLRGRNVPRQRMLEVAEHYYHFDGISPINAQCRALIASLEKEFPKHGIALPIYWGNRNWEPYLTDTVRRMRDDGVRSALAFATAAYSSYSSCRQYLGDIERAVEAVGAGAPHIQKLRPFFNHPGFIAANTDHAAIALRNIPVERHGSTRLLFTAHSIPDAMAVGCDYEAQLKDASAVIANSLGNIPWKLVFQSRSGPPTQPWLEPDIGEYLRQLASSGGLTDVVVIPVGFTSDHMEVMYDLDVEATQIASELGIHLVRASTAGTHPRFISMICELVLEQTAGVIPSAVGTLPPRPAICPIGCCPSGRPR